MRTTFFAALAVLLALPAAASARVGDLLGPTSRPFVVIAQGKYPHGRHWYGKDTQWTRRLQYGGVDPSVDTLKVVVKNHWVATPLIELTPERKAVAKVGQLV